MKRSPFPTPPGGVLALALAAPFITSGATAAGSNDDVAFEELGELPVESVLPARFLHSAHYAIEPTARAKDNFYHFTVTTDGVTREITSIAMLRIRLHEIATVAEVEPRLRAASIRLDRSPPGKRGVASERVVDIIADPIATAAELLGNIEYNVEQTFTARSNAEIVTSHPAATQDFNPGPHKRSAASQLTVDVYSSNASLQRVLNAVAKARSAGKTANSFSPLIRNVYAARPFGTGVLQARLDSHLKNFGSGDLNAEIEGSLVELDVPQRTRIAFLTHPAFTPRTRLYLTTYATLLEPLKQIDLLFSAATTAKTEADALAYVDYLRMLAFYQLHGGKLTEVITKARFPTVATSDGNAILVLPLDYLAWTRAVASAADALRGIRETHDLKRFIVLLAGTPTERSREELARRDVDILPNYSF